jgi:hypothetical protein
MTISFPIIQGDNDKRVNPFHGSCAASAIQVSNFAQTPLNRCG